MNRSKLEQVEDLSEFWDKNMIKIPDFEQLFEIDADIGL